MVAIPYSDTGAPKRAIIEMAYEECGSAGYEFERTPEEVAAAIRELNYMMYEWPFSLLGYVQAPMGLGDPDSLSGIPLDAVSAVAKHLALRIAPKMGATQSPESKIALSRSLLMLQAQYASIPDGDLAADTISGAGNRGRTWPYINESGLPELSDDPGDLAGLV